MIKSVKIFLGSPEVREAFKNNQLAAQINLGEVDMRAEVDKELVYEKSKLLNLMDDTSKGRLTTQFNQEIRTGSPLQVFTQPQPQSW